MPFECKKHHPICKGRCCGIIPIPVTTWQKNQHHIQKEVVEKTKCYVTDYEDKKETCVLPITQDMLCAFLKEDLSCAIYEDRPKVCRKFGDETHWALRCPMQHADGSPRSEDDVIELTTKVDDVLGQFIQERVDDRAKR